ncbi:NAD-binding protein [Virgibacillus sp. L01]|uniref:NAD-binding protein n=1 Tax=Virgibacillus sp. L01 TaxID=3457429 RepID=UPI003FD28CFD
MKNHQVIIGWNERSKQLIKEINEKKEEEKVVLIDATLDNPPELNFTFIKGDASKRDTLERADIEHAKTVVVTSESTEGEDVADQYSILVTISIRVANPNVKIITELHTKKHIENAKRAGATTIIRANEFMGGIFFHGTYTDCLNRSSIEQIISQQYKTSPVPNHLIGKQFRECQNKFLDKDDLLIGIVCNGKMSINPSSEKIINNGDLLISI